MIQELLPRIVAGAVLTEEEAFAIMQDILAGAATPAQIAGFAVALRMRGETVEEVTGLARALRQALPAFPDVPTDVRITWSLLSVVPVASVPMV